MLLKNSTSTIVQSFGFWSNLERWKSLKSGCLISWMKINFLKNILLKCHLLLLYATSMNHFSNRLRYVMKRGFYMTTGNDQLGGWTRSSKALFKVKLAPKKDCGYCLVVFCLSDPLQFSESQQNHYIWEVCSVINKPHWKLQWLPPALVNRMGSILHDDAWPHVSQPMLQKLNKLGCKILPHPPYSTASYQLTTTS